MAHEKLAHETLAHGIVAHGELAHGKLAHDNHRVLQAGSIARRLTLTRANKIAKARTSVYVPKVDALIDGKLAHEKLAHDKLAHDKLAHDKLATCRILEASE